MLQDLLQVTPDNPLIITTQEGLEQIMHRVMSNLGFEAKVPKVREVIQTELTTRGATKYLMERGHRVASWKAFTTLIQEYKITAVQRGKDKWYKIADLDMIPARN
jgi:hypothetical protein